MDAEHMEPTAVDFDAFWAWLKQHPNCLGEAGTETTVLFDHDLAHWVFSEDDHRRPLVQLMLGKLLIGELVMDVREVLFVQATPSDEPDGPVLFEVMTGPSEAPELAYRFVMQHGMENAGHHLTDAQ